MVEPGFLLSIWIDDHGGRHVAADEGALLVDQEHAVGVAVERDAEVALVLDHRALQIENVLRLDRIGLVVGEGAIELEVERDDLARQAGEDPRDQCRRPCRCRRRWRS